MAITGHKEPEKWAQGQKNAFRTKEKGGPARSPPQVLRFASGLEATAHRCTLGARLVGATRDLTETDHRFECFQASSLRARLRRALPADASLSAMKEPPRDQQPVMNSRPAMKCEPLRRSAWLHAFPILAKGPGGRPAILNAVILICSCPLPGHAAALNDFVTWLSPALKSQLVQLTPKLLVTKTF